MNKNTPRHIIFKILYKFFNTKTSLKVIFNNTIDKFKLTSNDIAFITNTIRGVLRDKKILDQNIQLYAKTKKIDTKTKILLYIGIYQLLYCDSIPNYASINTTVSLAKDIHKNSSGFINAILRNISAPTIVA